MHAAGTDLEGKAVQLALAFAAYNAHTVRLAERDLAGMTHILSSRQGLFTFNETRWRQLAHGFFFGITLRGPDIFVFECCDLPRSPTRMGRLVRLRREGERIAAAEVLCQGLDNGCHALDFVDGALHAVDTYNQRLLRFASDFSDWTPICPLPRVPEGGWRPDDPEYRHANSVLAVGDLRLLLLHNGAGHFDRRSELVVFDRDWSELERRQLDGRGCHSLAVLEDGRLMVCGSMEGTLLTPGEVPVPVSRYLTRGLAVGADGIVVGGSQQARREDRLRNTGTLSFLDPDWTLRATLDVPGAPMEIRRLDAQDASLSSYLAATGRTLRLPPVG